MDKLVACLNIEHYRKTLAKEDDETRRRTLLQLLAEEEAKLAAIENPIEKKKGRTRTFAPRPANAWVARRSTFRLPP